MRAGLTLFRALAPGSRERSGTPITEGGRLPPQPTLESLRLLLRPLDLADAPVIRSLAGAKAIADTTLTIPHPYPAGAAEAWIAEVQLAWHAGTMATFAIARPSGGELIGVVGLTIEAKHARAELGYWIGEPFWGNGFATEASRALCDYGFSALGLHRIYAHHFARNPASGRVMEKLGMTREGELRDAVRKGERFEDLVVYSVLASEWTGTSSSGA